MGFVVVVVVGVVVVEIRSSVRVDAGVVVVGAVGAWSRAPVPILYNFLMRLVSSRLAAARSSLLDAPSCVITSHVSTHQH